MEIQNTAPTERHWGKHVKKSCWLHSSQHALWAVQMWGLPCGHSPTMWHSNWYSGRTQKLFVEWMSTSSECCRQSRNRVCLDTAASIWSAVISWKDTGFMHKPHQRAHFSFPWSQKLWVLKVTHIRLQKPNILGNNWLQSQVLGPQPSDNSPPILEAVLPPQMKSYTRYLLPQSLSSFEMLGSPDPGFGFSTELYYIAEDIAYSTTWL